MCLQIFCQIRYSFYAMEIIGGVRVRNQKVDLDLKKLKRADLLEMLIASEREREALELQL